MGRWSMTVLIEGGSREEAEWTRQQMQERGQDAHEGVGRVALSELMTETEAH